MKKEERGEMFANRYAQCARQEGRVAGMLSTLSNTIHTGGRWAECWRHLKTM